MGYDSRVFVVEVNQYNSIDMEPYAEIIAMVNMCNMGYGNGWLELFKTPVNYGLYLNENETSDTDKYGDHLRSATVEDVIGWLEKEVKTEDYRRLWPLLSLLRGFNRNQWKDIQIVHYGY